jgi:hypothetical protein
LSSSRPMITAADFTTSASSSRLRSAMDRPYDAPTPNSMK